MWRYLLITGGTIFSLLGLLHLAYTVSDMHRPRRLVPLDPKLIEEMASVGLRLSRDRTSMWDTWIGFNFSHSLGLVVFGILCVAEAMFARRLAFPAMMLLVPVFGGVIYFFLAMRFWFREPAVGVAIGTAFLFMAWALYPK